MGGAGASVLVFWLGLQAKVNTRGARGAQIGQNLGMVDVVVSGVGAGFKVLFEITPVNPPSPSP